MTHHRTRGLRTSAQTCFHGCEGSKEQKPAEQRRGQSPDRPEEKGRRSPRSALGRGYTGFSPFPVQPSHFTTQERHTFFFSLSLETQKGLKRKRVHVASGRRWGCRAEDSCLLGPVNPEPPPTRCCPAHHSESLNVGGNRTWN